jgi:hypothetical protein
MGYSRQTALPAAEPVSLAEMKQRLRIDSSFTADDTLITGLIQAARETAEAYTGRALAQRTFTEVLDSFPYFTDTVQSQLAYPPSYYSLPRYSTTLWNYSQMIKLSNGPVVSVTRIRYVATDLTVQTLAQDVDFILDRQTESARLFPLPGSYWPPCLYVPNAVEIDYVTGFDPDPTAIDTHTVTAPSPPGQQTPSTIVTGVPQSIRDGIMAIVAFRYDNPAQALDVQFYYNLFGTNSSVDFAPTRG